MQSLKSSRRSFLKAVGASAMTLPFYRLLESSVAEAQSAATFPLRFLVIVTPHGTAYEYWRPQGTETNFNITYPNAILAPLNPFKSKILVLDGVDMRIESEDADFGHLGTPALLTGVGVTQATENNPGAESLDQFLARQLGGTTAYRSLELSVGDWSNYPTMSFDQTGNAVPRINNPLTAFTRMFSNVQSGPPSTAATRSTLEQKSVLDAIQADIGRLQTRLGPIEKQKLNQHLTAVRDMETRLTAMTTSTATCTVPTKPSGDWASTDSIDEYFTPQFLPEFGTITNLHMDVIAHSFACDLTRFASLQILHSGAEVGMPYVDSSLTNVDIHADIAHEYVYNSKNAVSGQLGMIQTYFATKLAYLLNELSQIPEGNGSVLDHTVILWSSDQGDPANHYYNNLPIVLAGGANNYFRMGRYVQYTEEVDPYCQTSDCNTPATTNLTWLTPHNQLLVSLCQAFGLTTTTFGSNESTGPLANLT
jgi:hypothetical protein